MDCLRFTRGRSATPRAISWWWRSAISSTAVELSHVSAHVSEILNSILYTLHRKGGKDFAVVLDWPLLCLCQYSIPRRANQTPSPPPSSSSAAAVGARHSLWGVEGEPPPPKLQLFENQHKDHDQQACSGGSTYRTLDSIVYVYRYYYYHVSIIMLYRGCKSVSFLFVPLYCVGGASWIVSYPFLYMLLYCGVGGSVITFPCSVMTIHPQCSTPISVCEIFQTFAIDWNEDMLRGTWLEESCFNTVCCLVTCICTTINGPLLRISIYCLLLKSCVFTHASSAKYMTWSTTLYVHDTQMTGVHNPPVSKPTLPHFCASTATTTD